MSTKVVPVIMGLGIATLALFLLTKKAAAAPEELPEELPPPVVPVVVPFNVNALVQEIRQARSLPELNAYYNLIGEKFITREISYVEYIALYNAYRDRFLELTGETEE